MEEGEKLNSLNYDHSLRFPTLQDLNDRNVAIWDKLIVN